MHNLGRRQISCWWRFKPSTFKVSLEWKSNLRRDHDVWTENSYKACHDSSVRHGPHPNTQKVIIHTDLVESKLYFENWFTAGKGDIYDGIYCRAWGRGLFPIKSKRYHQKHYWKDWASLRSSEKIFIASFLARFRKTWWKAKNNFGANTTNH